MIIVKNTQHKIAINIKEVERVAQKILDELDYSDFDLGIWLTTNKTIRHYNKEYRKKDAPTDILSFPYHPTLRAGQRIKVVHEEDKNIGDIIISLEYVQYLLPLYDDITLQERISIILVHGICHLLGYTHYDEANDAKMSKLEKDIARSLGLKGE